MDEVHYTEFENPKFDAKDETQMLGGTLQEENTGRPAILTSKPPCGSADLRFELVQRYRKRVPLPQLQKSLRTHHASARQELVELINEILGVGMWERGRSVNRMTGSLQLERLKQLKRKYADFVSLSSRMQGVERALKPLRAPLEESAELTKGLHSKLGSLLQKAEEAHQGLVRIGARKDALRAYIENARLLEKVRSSGTGIDAARNLQEAVARDLRRIRLSLQGAHAASPECQALLEEARFENGREAMSFQEDFSQKLVEQLRPLLLCSKRSWDAAGEIPNTEFLAICQLSRALCHLGHAALVEQSFGEVFVRAKLEELSATCNAVAEEQKRKAMAMAEGSKMVSAGAVDLAIFFHSVQETFFTEASALLWFARRWSSGSSGDVEMPRVRLLAEALVLPCLQKVQEVWPNVFMPAFPDTFAANYRHFSSFLRQAEEVMEVSEAGELQRKLVDFQRKWKTQVYCSLRTKEAAQRLDTAAQKLTLDSAEPGGVYWLPVSGELIRTIDLVWKAWYLSCLYPKMARLSLELVAKYGKAISAFVETSAGGAWDAAQQGWSASSLPVRFARAAADVLQVIASFSVEGSPGLVAQLFLEPLESEKDMIFSPMNGNRAYSRVWTAYFHKHTGEVAKVLLMEAARSLEPMLLLLKDGMVKQVAMGTPFAAIRGIPAFYRMLNKPVPTKASPYVESSLRPLTAFRDVLVGSKIAEDFVRAWLKEMVDAWNALQKDGAAQEFAVQATQLIEMMTHQQEASLRRLAGRGDAKGDDQAEGAPVSDLDKIYLQLCLDVDTFSSMASATAGSKPEGLQKLTEAVSGIRRTAT
ncbi:Conserved oligomeric Golgi complex subunit 2 (COG complex subunit 2) (Component of oligomeric Golgi complex 2) [Durusdinium trenchii]|uniref:Conserved oligomeric Golgi complex subunit 2 (COG complex subunit 2) (Component of oligomeric Golgi complex 2) n=1 Tax=Durusdinium trenchii TaxID=1381693 RepID=A0ABP0IBR3_9DINO